MGLAKALTSISTFIVMLLSLALILGGVWLATRSGGSECIKALQLPMMVIGSVLLLVSLAGFIGSVAEIAWLLFVYLIITFIAMWALLAFTLFAFLVTNQSAGAYVWNQGVVVYRVPDYSTWLQSQVNTVAVWTPMRSCVAGSDLCSWQQTNFSSPYNVYKANVGPLQTGCCLPPATCNYTFVNSTYWLPPPGVTQLVDPSSTNSLNVTTDCAVYSNKAEQRCFDCSTCKAGLLQTVRDDWRTIAYANLTITLLLFVVYTVGCCAYRSTRREHGMGFTKGIV